MRTLLVPAPLRRGDILLDGDQEHHARDVLRLRPGDAVRLADGAGRAAEAVVASAGPPLRLRCEEVDEGPPSACHRLLHVAVAPPKGDRWGDLVRALTELGVGAILPLVCARGERVPADPGRARRIAAEAIKQCRRLWLPQVGPPVGIAEVAASGRRIILAHRTGGPPAPNPPAPTTLVVGPEGGLDDGEVAALVAAGAVPTRLAGHILRIETAALAAAAVWATAWEHDAP